MVVGAAWVSFEVNENGDCSRDMAFVESMSEDGGQTLWPNGGREVLAGAPEPFVFFLGW